MYCIVIAGLPVFDKVNDSSFFWTHKNIDISLRLLLARKWNSPSMGWPYLAQNILKHGIYRIILNKEFTEHSVFDLNWTSWQKSRGKEPTVVVKSCEKFNFRTVVHHRSLIWRFQKPSWREKVFVWESNVRRFS